MMVWRLGQRMDRFQPGLISDLIITLEKHF